LEELQPFARQFARDIRQARDVPAGPSKALDESAPYRIRHERKDNWYRRRRLSSDLDVSIGGRVDDVYLEPD
jgi:hypothetical protein